MKKLFVLWMITLAVAGLAVTNTAPKPPHQFYGTVTINGQPAPVGASITARIDGEVRGSTVLSQEGEYGTGNDIFYVEEGSEDLDGQTIQFYVEGELAGSYTGFQNGQSTEFDLSVSIDNYFDDGSDSGSPSGTSGGGSGGGGSGGGAGLLQDDSETDSTGDSSSETDGDTSSDSDTSLDESTGSEGLQAESGATEESCTPDWQCSEWTACANGFQNRRCIDVNQCGTDEGKPTEQRECSTGDANETAPGITGAVIGGGSTSWLAGILAIAFLAALFLYARYRR